MNEYEAVGNNANREKLKELEKDLPQCPIVHHKLHMEWPGILGLCGERLASSEQWHGCRSFQYQRNGHKQ